jgi:ribosomal protein L11 methyltransferase
MVHGAHDRALRTSNLISIEIEAGEAFGTGHHGSTAGCLAAIDALARRRHFRSAFDLGTGSGILAIAVARRLRIPVLATDIDPRATRLAELNARRNRAGGGIRFLTAAGPHHPVIRRSAPYDLVLANILAGPLIAFARDLSRLLTAGGLVVLSGILQHQAARVAAASRSVGLVLERRLLLDGWVTLILRKTKGGPSLTRLAVRR